MKAQATIRVHPIGTAEGLLKESLRRVPWVFSIERAVLSDKESAVGKRGQALRPCPRCGAPVKFVWWQEEAARRHAKVWHWVTEGGTHHLCGERSPATRAGDRGRAGVPLLARTTDG